MVRERREEHVKINYEDKCQCTSRSGTEMFNYSMMWHEADICCADCGKFVRFWDAG